MSQPQTHPVLFVGAGPGDPELITVAGRRALEQANLVVYAGSLVSRDMLGWCRLEATAVDSAGLDLAAIAGHLVEGHRQGRRVVRLHTGDPSRYGALHEQLNALDIQNVPWRIIPGVTAAFAATASLGLEYTLPEVCQSLIITRAPGRTPVPAGEDLATLAAHGASLAIYLSAGQGGTVSAALSSALGPDSPVAVVYRASWPDERLLWTTAKDLPQDLEAADLKRQALILAGPAVATLARELTLALPEATLFLPQGLADPVAGEEASPGLTPALAANFGQFGGHVIFAAAGIVVRVLAPLLRHKAQDPAVVVVNQAGSFAVSLLSGHLGGANALARRVAEVLGGQAVITTATDSAGLPSLEMLAGELGFRVENLAALAKVSMALLEGQQPAVCDPAGWLWPTLQGRWPGLFSLLEPDQADQAGGQPLIWVGHSLLEPRPSWLVLRSPALWAGIGCNRGTNADEMESLLRRVQAKSDEPGLLELAARLGLPLIFFSAEELALVEVPNPSATVARHMGVASVCEAAALLAGKSRRLLVSKQKSQNATLALALAGPEAGSTS